MSPLLQRRSPEGRNNSHGEFSLRESRRTAPPPRQEIVIPITIPKVESKRRPEHKVMMVLPMIAMMVEMIVSQ
jgi:hypothetical protein